MIDPHKILTISSKRTFDTCPRCWVYRYVLNLAPKETAEALVRGTEFHEGAEATHSGGDSDKINTAKRLAYDKWVKQYDDLRTENTEIPMLVPLEALYNYAQMPMLGLARGWYYGGVADAIAVHDDIIDAWILDHKTVERFYPVSQLFSLEQIAMYCVAYEILYGLKLAGGIVSRVKQLEAHPNHILNHALKQIEGLTKSFLNVVLKRDKSSIKVTKSNITKLSTEQEQYKDRTSTVLGGINHFSRIKLRPKGLKLGITSYDSDGFLIQSVRDMRGQLIHIQRHYYPLTRIEKQEIVKDFLRYAEIVILSAAGVAEQGQDRENFGRRSPGMYCNNCPFRFASEEERRTGKPLGSCIRPEDFIIVAPHSELTSKLPGYCSEDSK